MAADSKAKFLQDAERYMLHGKAQQAIGEYLKIVKVDPHDVLILNTIGDLYLRQGKSSEANKYFLQVAEIYVQNNFFLKAIAVYKKILNADPNNLDINSIMASLYAKQGLSIDARNQYARVASLLEKEGRAREQMDAYEKIVELDPTNSTIQRKLAELYLSEGDRGRSHAHWTGAARAQTKAGDFKGAADSYGHAAQLDPLDVEAMRGFLDCCLKLNTPVAALVQLKQSVELAPQNLDLRELLGHAYLANKDPETAAKTFQTVVSLDDARYGSFLEVARTYINKNEYDQAVACLDNIIPTLISRRETERAVQLYQEVLRHSPDHILTMVKLASVYAATGDQVRYLDMLVTIAEHYVAKKSPIEALEYLEKILQADPESEKHRKLHRQIFTEVYPDTPYVAPAEPPEIRSLPEPPLKTRDGSPSEQRNPSEIVEVDLLINYGLRDKALGLLQSLESRDPYEKEVRLRLLSLYKAENKFTEAAEQCLLLAALHRRSNNEASALSCLAEAKQLSPEIAEYEKDLDGFARRNGIEPESSASAGPRAGTHNPGAEVDLSSDLLDIFFSGDQLAEGEDHESDETAEVISEAYPQHIPSQAPAKSVQEQLQEVDFYIRLGFHDEALARLNEIAKNHPGKQAVDLDLAAGAVRGRLPQIELVADVADELLDQVLQGHDPRRAAILVDHDRHVAASVAHLLHRRQDRFAVGEPQHRPYQALDPERLLGHFGVEQIAHMHEPDHIVGRAIDDRIAGVRHLPDLPDGLGHRQCRVQELHLCARHRDLGQFPVAGGDDLVDEVPLLGAQRVLRRHESAQLLSRDTLLGGTRIAAEQPHDGVRRD